MFSKNQKKILYVAVILDEVYNFVDFSIVSEARNAQFTFLEKSPKKIMSFQIQKHESLILYQKSFSVTVVNRPCNSINEGSENTF